MKGIKRSTFTCNNKRYTSRIFGQFPFFKYIYLYQAQNKLPSTKSAKRKTEALAVKYILLDSLLFKIVSCPEKDTVVLAILEVCTDKTITLYHSSLFAEHQGLIKIYLTICDEFFIPNLIHYLCSYIKGCHICQLTCKKSNQQGNCRLGLI